MIARVLSTRELNRTLLARQLLLERSPLALCPALEQLAGLQTQYAPSAYVALWSRLRGFSRPALTGALEKRQAVQATLMRSTIHVVSASDFHLFGAGIRRGRREWWLRVQRGQVDETVMEAAAELLERHLAGGPRRAGELKALLQSEGFPAAAWSGVRHWVDMVRVPPSGTWEQRRADLYGLARDWLGDSTATEHEGLEHLVRRYLEGFGPASVNDIANWAGVPVKGLVAAVERVAPLRFRAEGGVELVDLADAPLLEPDAVAPARFLPTWDATLLIHARRTQILPEAYRPLVFNTRTPHSVPTFLVDGAVAGRWGYKDGEVRLEPFRPLASAALRELEEEAARLAEFHAG